MACAAPVRSPSQHARLGRRVARHQYGRTGHGGAAVSRNRSAGLHVTKRQYDVFRLNGLDRLYDEQSNLVRPNVVLGRRRFGCDQLLAISQPIRGNRAVRGVGSGGRQQRRPDGHVDARLGRPGQHVVAARHSHRDVRAEWHVHELDGRFEPCRHLPGSERPRHSGRGSVGGPSGQHPDDCLEQYYIVIRRQQRERFLCCFTRQLRLWPWSECCPSQRLPMPPWSVRDRSRATA